MITCINEAKNQGSNSGQVIVKYKKLGLELRTKLYVPVFVMCIGSLCNIFFPISHFTCILTSQEVFVNLSMQ